MIFQKVSLIFLSMGFSYVTMFHIPKFPQSFGELHFSHFILFQQISLNLMVLMTTYMQMTSSPNFRFPYPAATTLHLDVPQTHQMQLSLQLCSSFCVPSLHWQHCHPPNY